MKAGRTLTELAQEIERRANAKQDFVASTKNLTMYGGGVPEQNGDITLEIGNKALKVNELAHDQIGGHCDIPAKYYDKMRAEAPDLLASNVNRWFQKYPAARMVRTLDGAARAFLSDKYRPLENEDLAAAVLPVIGEMDLAIMSCEVTDRRLYIKAVDKKVCRELAKTGNYLGDGKHMIVRVTSPAITISNSEVGSGALSVQAGVYDDWCSNLATFGARSLRKQHVGSRHELVGDELFAMLSDETRRKTDEALWAQVREVVRIAFDRAKFDSLVDKIEGSQADKLETDDVVRTVTFATKRLGLNEGEGKSVLKHLIEGGDLSRYGLYNAVTRAAQDDALSYDRATELERVGAQVIELPKSEWRELAKAA